MGTVYFDKDAWAAKKQAEREDTYRMIDTFVHEMSIDGGLFRSYLDVQARFDLYSVSNAILIAAQCPEATRLADFDSWKDGGVYVKRGAEAITILEPRKEYTRQEDGSTGVFYDLKKVFDISQPNSPQRPTPIVTRDERLLLKALMTNAPCRFASVLSFLLILAQFPLDFYPGIPDLDPDSLCVHHRDLLHEPAGEGVIVLGEAQGLLIQPFLHLPLLGCLGGPLLLILLLRRDPLQDVLLLIQYHLELGVQLLVLHVRQHLVQQYRLLRRQLLQPRLQRQRAFSAVLAAAPTSSASSSTSALTSARMAPNSFSAATMALWSLSSSSLEQFSK